MSNFASKINVVSELDIDGFSNEVAIVIDGKPFRFWNNLQITKNFDTIADTFSLSAPFDPDNADERENFRPYKYQDCAVYIGGEKVLTGKIITPSTNTTANSRTVTVEGYSLPGILNDCNVPASSWPISINGLDLQEIAVKFAGDYGVEVDFQGSPGAKFTKRDKVEIDPSMHIYDLFTGLARQRGFVLSSDVDGNLIFRQTVTSVPVSIKEGINPYLTSKAVYNGQNRFSDITVIKQQSGRGSGQKTTVKDSELTGNGVLRSRTISAEDTEMGNLKTAANTKLGHMLADSVKVDLTLSNWRRYDNGQLWKDGDLINFYSPGDMIYVETTFLVRTITFNRTADSMTASFNIVFPESYGGGIRTVFPWA